jgi:hypothetical protein
MKSKFLISAICVAATSMSFGQTFLAPGSSVLNPTLAAGTLLGGNYNIIALDIENVTGMDTFSNVKFTGTFWSYVFQDKTSGDLAFADLYENDSTSVDAVNHFSVSGFAGFQTAVAQDPLETVTPNVNSVVASRSADGDVISFNFLAGFAPSYDEIAPGINSSAQVIFTDATSYTWASAQITDGAVATVKTYAPNAVSEPISMLTLGTGALALLRRKRS